MEINLRNLVRLTSASVFITVFLVLSYCPLRRAIQDLLKGTTETQQQATGPQAALVVCQGIIDNSAAKFTLPHPKPGISIPVFAAVIVSLFYTIYRFFCVERVLNFQRKFSVAYLNSVPIYLKNRILLI